MLNSRLWAAYERAKLDHPWLERVACVPGYAVKSADSALALGVLGGWMLTVGLPLRLRGSRSAGRDPGAPLRACLVSSEGAVVAPTRIRCYKFAEQIREAGVAVDVLAFWSDLLGYEALPPRPLTAVERMVAALRATHRLLPAGYDVVSFQRPTYDVVTAALLRWLAGTEIVFDVDDWIFEYPAFIPVRARHLLPILGRLGGTCVVSSQPLAEHLRSYFGDVVLVPTFADVRAFQPGPRAARDEVVFGWNGTMFQHFMVSAVQVMVEAFALAHARVGGDVRIRLEITGTGSYFSELEAWIKERHAERPIALRGWIDPAQMNTYLDTVDVGLYTLRLPDTRYSGHAIDALFVLAKSPTKLFEYMAKGIPVISTSVGEAPRFVEHGVTGFIGDDVEALADHMVRLARDPALRERVGAEARRRCVAEFSLDRAGRDVAGMLRRVVGQATERDQRR